MQKMANKVRTWNSVTRMDETDICNDERLAQLRAMPFITIEKVERVMYDEDQIEGLGGVTPAFQRMWNGIGNKKED